MKKIFILTGEPSGDKLAYKVISNLRDFKSASDLIVANRVTNELKDVESKIFTRDVFGTN